MIDMHIHTNNSDGTDTVEELLEKAQTLGLEYISITDHDTCKAYEVLEKIDIPTFFSGKIIPGIEIKCSYRKRTIEVLGYKIDTNKMNKWLNEFYKDKQREDLQKKYFDMLYEKCIKMGFELRAKEEIQWNPKNDWASFTMYTEIKRNNKNQEIAPKDMWEEFSSFNRKYCSNPEHILYIDKSEDYPTLNQAIKAIKEAGGLAFMPHLYIYKWMDNKEEFIQDIVNNYEVDGIECYYTDFSQEQTDYLLQLCDDKRLFKSGGSDYHGKNKERISLGIGYGNLNIKSNLIKDWV